MDIKIRPAIAADLEEIIRIQKKAFIVQADRYDAYDIPPMVEKPEDIKLDSSNLVVLVAEADGVIAGSVRVGYDGDEAEIKRLSVSDEFQSMGIGRKLMAVAEEKCIGLKRIWLFTGGQSYRNIEIYKKLGFSVYKEEPWKGDFTLIYLEKLI